VAKSDELLRQGAAEAAGHAGYQNGFALRHDSILYSNPAQLKVIFRVFQSFFMSGFVERRLYIG
jgi:hypothetical protein